MKGYHVLMETLHEGTKIMKTKAPFTVAAVFTLLVSACFSPWQGDEGTLIISVGDSSSRTLVNVGSNEQASFSYELIMTGPGGEQTYQFDPGATSLTVKVPHGEWQVEVRAMGPVPAIDGANLFSSPTLRAFGEWEGTVSPGGNTTAGVTMYSASEVTSWAQLEAAVDDGTVGGDRKEIIFLKNGGSWDVIAVANKLGIDRPIELRAVEAVTIKWVSDNTYEIFQVGEKLVGNGHLTLKGPLTLEREDSTKDYESLICVYSKGILEMYDGVILQNNNTHNGGGVAVTKGGTFTMYGGTIKNNKADESGGGVYVDEDSIFTMSGGMIFGNTAGSGNSVYGDAGSIITIFGQTMETETTPYVMDDPIP